MKKRRKFPLQRYYLFIVEAIGEFKPDDWRQRPRNYRVVESHGYVELSGKRDAWRFLHNYEAWKNGTADQRWAIFVG